METAIQEKLLDGKRVSANLLTQLGEEIAVLTHRKGIAPKLSVILAGDDSASQIYVNRKAKAAGKIGIKSMVHTFGSDVSEGELIETIHAMNNDESVHAILIQLPLPKHLDEEKILSLVKPEKDVDGFHPVNLGKLLSGAMPDALPCTPSGIMTLMRSYGITPEGRRAVVLGRSTIVGKPMGLLLLQENATVTFCHSRTKNLEKVTREAEILVAAVGVPEMITGDHISPGAVVIDVGINRVDGKIVGDVHFDSVIEKASFVTPVPGGVGPMTIATLMANTVALYRKSDSKGA